MVGIGILAGTFGYMVVGIINDSMIVTAPLFWALIGIGLAIDFIIKRDKIFAIKEELPENGQPEKNDINNVQNKNNTDNDNADTNNNSIADTDSDTVDTDKADALNSSSKKSRGKSRSSR